MEDLTESVDTEPTDNVEVAETEVNTNIDDMSDEEFSKHFDNVKADGSNKEPEADKTVDKDNVHENDLEGLYVAQMSDADAKLDKPVFIKVNGEVMEITNINDLKNMAERGNSVTRKFQKLAEDRKALEKQLQDLNVEPDVQDESISEVEDVSSEILESSYAEDFKSNLVFVPDEIRNELAVNANMLKGLSYDFSTGLAQQILPKVKREMAINGVSFQDAYVSIGKNINAQKENVQKQKQVLKAEPKQTKYQAPSVDVDNMSNDEFDRYFANL